MAVGGGSAATATTRSGAVTGVGRPLAMVTSNPVAVEATIETLMPLAGSLNVSPGSHMARRVVGIAVAVDVDDLGIARRAGSCRPCG